MILNTKDMEIQYVKMTEDFADSFLTILMYCATLSEDCKVDKDNEYTIHTERSSSNHK